jgi:hypothetical protein
MTDLTNAKLLNKDILVKLKPKAEIEQSRFILKESVDQTDLQFFTVLLKSEDVTMINVGDTVICSWLKITPPFKATFNGESVNVGITSEKEILAVVDNK